MSFSGNTWSRHNRTGAVLLALGAGVLLAACKHSNNTTVTKGLWVANGTNVLEFIPAQFTGGVVDVAPHITLTGSGTATTGAPQGVTFDSAGNLWVIDPGATVNGAANTPALIKFTAAQLAALGTTPNPEPMEIVTSTDLAFPQQSVFDSAGNQWVSDHTNNTVLVFSAAQLAASGTNATTPSVVITSTTFNGPLGIAFDSAGNLWVANNGGDNPGTTIVEFAKASLPTPGTGTVNQAMTPTITLSDDGNGSVQAPWQLQFDSSGNLWSSNAATPFTLVEFAKASLMATAAPTPMTTISPVTDGGAPSLDNTNGLCFDNLGDIAATNAADAFGIPFYKAPLKTGAITPSTFFLGATTTLNAPAGCNFGPLVK